MTHHFTVYCGFYPPPPLLLHGLPGESAIFDLLFHGLLRLTAAFTYIYTVFTRPLYFYTAYPARASFLIYYFTAYSGVYLLLHGLLENVIFDLLYCYYFTAYCGYCPPLLLLHGPPEGAILDLPLHGLLRFSPAPPKSTRPARERHFDLYYFTAYCRFYPPPKPPPTSTRPTRWLYFDLLLHGLLRGGLYTPLLLLHGLPG